MAGQDLLKQFFAVIQILPVSIVAGQKVNSAAYRKESGQKEQEGREPEPALGRKHQGGSACCQQDSQCQKQRRGCFSGCLFTEILCMGVIGIDCISVSLIGFYGVFIGKLAAFQHLPSSGNLLEKIFFFLLKGIQLCLCLCLLFLKFRQVIFVFRGGYLPLQVSDIA